MTYIMADSKVEAFCFFFKIEDETNVDEEMFDIKNYILFDRKTKKAAIVKELFYSWELQKSIYDVRPVSEKGKNEK